MDNIFGSSGLLSHHLPGYETRPGQLEMGQAVHQLLSAAPEEHFLLQDQSNCLVVEAETGLGKTLAYLVPAVLSKRKVVVSTNTKNLQDQIIEREIPFIKKNIDPKLSALCVKGRQNYLCRYRWNQLRSTKQTALFSGNTSTEIDKWIETSRHGDRSELTSLSSSSSLWQKICCLSHFCLGSDCPENHGCFLNRLRKDAAVSQVLVVNHHLLFSDLAVRRGGYGEVLPRYDAVIFDEAHHVENVASTFFGHSISRYQLLDLTGDIERSAPGKKIQQAVDELNGVVERFNSAFPKETGRYLLHQYLHENNKTVNRCALLISALQRLANTMANSSDNSGPMEQFSNRALDLISRLEMITALPFDDMEEVEVRYTYWCERTKHNLSLSATPIDVSSELQSTLFSSVADCLFTSATLTAGESFSFFLKRLGLPEETRTLSFPSPFNYSEQTLLYVPQSPYPEPSSPGYQETLHAELKTLIHHSQGRALVLFTSFQAMDAAFYALEDSIDHPLMAQGDAPRHELLKRFTSDTHSVLFAVSSFWEGVDIPGESLSLLIIDKLPFEVPSDPVIMARINRIKNRGGNPFFEFQVPRAILSLRQGVGRLMRSSSDRGVIAILDIRLFSKGYGKRFLKSLPPSPLCRTTEEVAAFFTHIDHANTTT